jgi:hypothetical protein
MNSKSKSKEKSNYAQTQVAPNQTKEKKEEKTTKAYTQGNTIEEDFEDMIMDISLKRPKSAYNYFVQEFHTKSKSTSPITETTKEASKKWAKLKNDEKEKYQKLSEEDNQRFQEHLALVRKFIIDKPKKEKVTAYQIYIDEQVAEAIENGKDTKKAREEARLARKDLSDNDFEIIDF